MGVRIMEGKEVWDGACLYCSTSMWAFGPIFEDAIAAQEFLDWLVDDARKFSDKQLKDKYHDWLEEREEAKEENET